jgi:hypothetical protein
VVGFASGSEVDGESVVSRVVDDIPLCEEGHRVV